MSEPISNPSQQKNDEPVSPGAAQPASTAGGDASGVNRRDLLKVGAATIGAALIEPVGFYYIAGDEAKMYKGAPIVTPRQKVTEPTVDNFPTSLPKAKLDRPNIVVISLDSVRADRLSCCGYRREKTPNVLTTPNIDAFAKDARVYKNVLSPSSFPLASYASLFTGLSASAHGAHWAHQSLDKRIPTLAEQLTAAGYQTVGYPTDFEFLTPRTAIQRGFQSFRFDGRGKDATTVMHSSLAKWFGQQYKAEKPFFVFLHYMGAHQPYLPPRESLQFTSADVWERWNTIERLSPDKKEKAKETLQEKLREMQKEMQKVVQEAKGNVTEKQMEEVVEREKKKVMAMELVVEREVEKLEKMAIRMNDFTLTGGDLVLPNEIDELESLYDDAIRNIDSNVGVVLDFIKSTGLDENTAVFITSNHGEHFGEHHMMMHDFSLYEPVVRVPLMVRWPDRFPAGEEDGLVQSHDIYPTVLELAGLEWKPSPGQTCQSLLRPAPEPRIGISEYLVPDYGSLDRVARDYPTVDCTRFVTSLRAIQRGNMKLIVATDAKPELYDLSEDVLEAQNLAEKKPAELRELSEALDAWTRSFEHYKYVPEPEEPEGAPGELTPPAAIEPSADQPPSSEPSDVKPAVDPAAAPVGQE